MNLQHLEYFVNVARTQNFSASAKVLSVSQPALSKAIANLEQTVGVPLFEKCGRNVKLTQYGEVFANYASAAINEINAGIIELNNMSIKNASRVMLASPHSANMIWEGQLLHGFNSDFPQVKVGVFHMDYAAMTAAIKSGIIDFGISFDDNAVRDPDIENIYCGCYSLSVLLSRNNPLARKETLSFADLKDETILMAFGELSKKFAEYVKAHTHNPQQSFSYMHWQEITGSIERNEGVYICQADEKCFGSDKYAWRILTDEVAKRKMFLLRSRYKQSTPAMDDFKNYLCTHYGK